MQLHKILLFEMSQWTFRYELNSTVLIRFGYRVGTLWADPLSFKLKRDFFYFYVAVAVLIMPTFWLMVPCVNGGPKTL